MGLPGFGVCEPNQVTPDESTSCNEPGSFITDYRGRWRQGTHHRRYSRHRADFWSSEKFYIQYTSAFKPGSVVFLKLARNHCSITLATLINGWHHTQKVSMLSVVSLIVEKIGRANLRVNVPYHWQQDWQMDNDQSQTHTTSAEKVTREQGYVCEDHDLIASRVALYTPAAL